jgi:hypothetical protein
MKSPILVALILFVFSSCIEKKISLDFIGQNAAESLTKEVLKSAGINGGALRYDAVEPVFDIVIFSETTLYWKSLNPK